MQQVFEIASEEKL